VTPLSVRRRESGEGTGGGARSEDEDEDGNGGVKAMMEYSHCAWRLGIVLALHLQLILRAGTVEGALLLSHRQPDCTATWSQESHTKEAVAV
jgi:hypothetical protein